MQLLLTWCVTKGTLFAREREERERRGKRVSISVINAFYPFALNLIILLLQAIELILKKQLKDGLELLGCERRRKKEEEGDKERENRPYELLVKPVLIQANCNDDCLKG